MQTYAQLLTSFRIFAKDTANFIFTFDYVITEITVYQYVTTCTYSHKSVSEKWALTKPIVVTTRKRWVLNSGLYTGWPISCQMLTCFKSNCGAKWFVILSSFRLICSIPRAIKWSCTVLNWRSIDFQVLQCTNMTGFFVETNDHLPRNVPKMNKFCWIFFTLKDPNLILLKRA